jgi:hypothetical protein
MHYNDNNIQMTRDTRGIINMKKYLAILLAAVLVLAMFAGCVPRKKSPPSKRSP